MTGELFSEDRSVQVVSASFANTPDPRTRQVMTSLVRHLHDFVKDVRLTEDEWVAAIRFLTETGKMCSGIRQEFVLLSDVLGVSMLVETINNRSDGSVTASTIEGPFHVVDSPERELGAVIALVGDGDPCLVTGSVTGVDGRPLPGAKVDVWQANAEGFYDIQQPGVQPERNLRGLFTADDAGRYRFRTIVPSSYPIEDDGPVGKMLVQTARHPNRPAHIHFEFSAPGMRTLTTHLFVAGSPYIDDDTVFGVVPSLVREFRWVDDPERAAEVGLANPFRTVDFTVVLAPAQDENDA